MGWPEKLRLGPAGGHGGTRWAMRGARGWRSAGGIPTPFRPHPGNCRHIRNGATVSPKSPCFGVAALRQKMGRDEKNGNLRGSAVRSATRHRHEKRSVFDCICCSRRQIDPGSKSSRPQHHPDKTGFYLATQPVKVTSFRMLLPIALANDSWHWLKVGNGPAVEDDLPPDVPDEVQ